MNHFHPFLRKSIVVILVFFLLAVIGLVSLTFLRPGQKPITESRIINSNINKVWQSIYHKELYLNSRKEISKYIIYDTINPKWVEYYGSSDSQNAFTVLSSVNSRFHYVTYSKKYLQVAGYQIKLSPISEDQTKVSIIEHSIYYNTWANIYMRILKPKASIDYEFLKITNTINYIDSQQNNLIRP